MSEPSRWEQPDRSSPWAGPAGLLRRAAPGLLVAAVPTAALITGTALPVPVAVGLVGLGAFLFVRRVPFGGPWQGFEPPTGLTYRASDPEFGATLGGRLSLPGHTFENLLGGRVGVWEWTYVEVVGGGARREGLLVIDLGSALPPVRAVRVAPLTRTDELGRAFRDVSLPGRIVGRTGPYTFPAKSNPDPGFLTSLVTPDMTRALERDLLPGWAIVDHHLFGTPSRVNGSRESMFELTQQVDQLVAIAEAIRDATGIVPPPPPPRWPTLG